MSETTLISNIHNQCRGHSGSSSDLGSILTNEIVPTKEAKLATTKVTSIRLCI